MILTVGDSFTFGEELSDIDNQCWPTLLADRFKRPVLNLGKSGACNDSMIRNVIDRTSRRLYDLVIVGWTDIERFEAWSERSQMPVSIMFESLSGLPWVDDYYKYSYNHDFAFERWIRQILLLQQYLKSIDQPYLFINVAGQLDYEKNIKNITSLAEKIDVSRFIGWPARGMIEITSGCPKGPGGHPLEQGHERIANEITTHIRNLGWLS